MRWSRKSWQCFLFSHNMGYLKTGPGKGGSSEPPTPPGSATVVNTICKLKLIRGRYFDCVFGFCGRVQTQCLFPLWIRPCLEFTHFVEGPVSPIIGMFRWLTKIAVAECAENALFGLWDMNRTMCFTSKARHQKTGHQARLHPSDLLKSDPSP